MIISDVSVVALPGKTSELVAVVKELATLFDENWPAPMPRHVAVEVTGETGRVHLRAGWETLADHDRSSAEQRTDARVQALGERINALVVPGSQRLTYLRAD